MNIRVLIVVCGLNCGCVSNIRVTDTHYCNDTLFYNYSNKVVTGRVIYVNNEGNENGFAVFRDGLPDGPFEERGYDLQILHRGVNTPVLLKNISTSLESNYQNCILSEMYEGDFLINIITLTCRNKNTPKDSVNTIKHAIQAYFKEVKNKSIKIDTVIFNLPEYSSGYKCK